MHRIESWSFPMPSIEISRPKFRSGQRGEDLLDARDHLLGERTVGWHPHVAQVAVLVVQLDDLGEVGSEEGLPPCREQQEEFAQAPCHLVDLIEGELIRLAFGPLLVEIIEAVATAQVAHLGDEVNEVNRHGILLEEHLPAVPQELGHIRGSHGHPSKVKKRFV